jgi:hypothetical protein
MGAQLTLRRTLPWALATLLVAPSAARAGADGAVSVRARPDVLVLGDDALATIEIEAPGGDVPLVTTNVGRIERVRAVAAGKFEADFLPPEEAYPQVAIVAAVSGERCGWAAIPLSGRGVAVARSAPYAPIRVTIGGASFGPVHADASGEARVPVIAPAGARFAFHRDRPLALNVPATVHVHAAVGRASAAADAEQQVRVWLLAVTPSGAPRAAAPVVAEVTHGTVGDLVEGAPGERAATWRLPPGAARPATITVRLSDEPGPAFAATVARPAGPAARLDLEAAPSRVVAGEAAAVALRLRVADAAGNAVAAEPLIESDFGAVSSAVAVGEGAWEASLRIPAEIGARRRAELVARAAGLERRAAVELAPAPVAVAAATTPPDEPERRLSIAPKLGVAGSAGGLRSAYLGAEAVYRPGLLDGRLGLVLEAGTFGRERTDEASSGLQRLAVRGRARFVPVTASALWRGTFGRRQAAWASAGAGVAHVRSEVAVAGGPARIEAGLAPVAQAAVAWGIRAGRATPYAEARVAWHGDPRLESLRGSLTVLTLALGCRYDAF